jgi:hypothetical protein
MKSDEMDTLSFSKRIEANGAAASLCILSPIILLLYNNFQIKSNAAGLCLFKPFRMNAKTAFSLRPHPKKFQFDLLRFSA